MLKVLQPRGKSLKRVNSARSCPAIASAAAVWRPNSRSSDWTEMRALRASRLQVSRHAHHHAHHHAGIDSENCLGEDSTDDVGSLRHVSRIQCRVHEECHTGFAQLSRNRQPRPGAEPGF